MIGKLCTCLHRLSLLGYRHHPLRPSSSCNWVYLCPATLSLHASKMLLGKVALVLLFVRSAKKRVELACAALLFGSRRTLDLALAFVAFAAVASDGFDLVLLCSKRYVSHLPTSMSAPVSPVVFLCGVILTLKYSLVASSYSFVSVLGLPPAKYRVRPKMTPETATPIMV